MFETVNRLMLASLGAMSMTRERAERIFEEYVRRGQAERIDRESFVNELIDTAERGRLEMESLIERQLRQTITRLELVTRDDLVRIESKLDQLLLRTGGA